ASEEFCMIRLSGICSGDCSGIGCSEVGCSEGISSESGDVSTS
ncbi:hypothetical protein A2U01_0113578, partial [Trifolium medium]|nr:hypothetical protein [Trifolium medium]